MPDMLLTHEDQHNLEHIILREHVMTKIMLFQFSTTGLKNANIDIIIALLRYVNYLFDVVIARRMDNLAISSEISLNLDIDIAIRRAESICVKTRTVDAVIDIGQWIERRLASIQQAPAEAQMAVVESIQTLLMAAYAYVIRSGVEAWSYNVSDQIIAHREYNEYRVLKLTLDAAST
jgi:hypothetical protein